VPGRELLDSLLDEIVDHPERRAAIERRIDNDFVREHAVLVLDMSGFSRTTQMRGIVQFLLVIRRLRVLADPIVWKHRGTIVKAEADNLFCLFPSVEEAVGASREIIAGLHAANAALPKDDELYVSIGIGYGRIHCVGEEDVLGDEVNLASKLGEDVAGYGEILLTEAAREELEGAAVEERLVAVSGLELRHFAVAAE
jgi:adenylate cyclase